MPISAACSTARKAESDRNRPFGSPSSINRLFRLLPYTGSMDREEQIACLRLIRTPNIGPMTFSLLLQRYGSAAEALRAVPDLARRGGRSLKPATRAVAETELAANKSAGARLLFKGGHDYPARLGQFDDAPPVLSAKGAVHLLGRPGVAIVGARNASINAQRLAQSLAEDLGSEGYVVISGLARGIDAAAHNGALAGGTIAVIAGGIDVVSVEIRISANRLPRPACFLPRCRQARSRHRGISRSATGSLAHCPRHGRRGSGRAVRVSHHSKGNGRTRRRGDGRPGIAARPAFAGLQSPDPRGCDIDTRHRRHHRMSLAADRRQRAVGTGLENRTADTRPARIDRTMPRGHSSSAGA